MGSYPNIEKRANRLVVTSLQIHVTPIYELLDIVASPQDSVTPCRYTALPTAGIHDSFRQKPRLKQQTHTYRQHC